MSGIAAGSLFNVTVTDNGATKTYVATVNIAGTGWSATIPSTDAVALANGTATVSAQVTDANGNQASFSQAVTVAETGPTLTIAAVEGNNIINFAEAHAAGGVPLSGTVSGIAAGSLFNVTVTDNGVTKTYVATVNIAGTGWSATIPSTDAVALANGTATVSAQVTDANGNQASFSQAVTVAETGPTLTIAAVEGNNVINAAEAAAGVPLAGTVSGIAAGSLFNVTVTDNGATKTYVATVNIAGTGWSATIPSTDAVALANGTATVSAQVTDANGNQASFSQAVTVAETGPTLTIAAVEGNNIINFAEAHAAGGVPLSGTVSGIAAGSLFNVTVTDNGVTKTYVATVNIAGTGWNATIPASDATALANGTATVSAQVTDANGNQASFSQAVTVAETGPTLTIAPVEGNNVINFAEAAAGVPLAGTVSGIAAGSLFNVTVTDNGVTKTYVATVNATGTGWSATIPASDALALAIGTATVSAQVTDANGNQSAPASQTVTVATNPNSWANPSGGSWTNAANWSSGTVPSSTSNVQLSPFGTTPYTITILPNTTVVVNSLTISDPNVTLLDEFSLSILASLVTSAGLLQVSNGGTLSVGSAAGFTVNFVGTGGNLALVSSFTGTVDAISAADGAVTIAGAGNVTSVTGDAVDLLATGGTQSNLAVGLTGTVTGAANGITVTQNAFGNVAVTTSGPVGGEAGYGILAVESATGSGSIQVGGSGNVTGTGNANDGILAEILNAADGSGVTVDQTGSISGGYDAIRALTEGNGNITITTGPNATITAGRFYGIEADSTGTGSILVTTTTNDVITSGSAGILAVNLATSVPQNGGVTTSSISIMTVGTIDSGYQLTVGSNRPAGILAGYLGGQTGTPNAAVIGNVVVDNSANIDAAGGDGIRAFNYGSGNVNVLDGASTTIVAPQGFGAEAVSFGTGSVSISTVASDIINSGSDGINAANLATAIAAGAASSASVSASGTINSGIYLTPNGAQPAGVSAGYVPGSASTPNANVNGTVSIDNSANVTASAGWGIDAFNWGNGSVTLTDEANTTVSGAQYGIAAYSQGPTSGSATINVLTGATISAGSLYGLNGISAFANNGGNVLVTTTAGDVVNSGGIGIAAGNSATSAPATSEISITTVGTINSGFDMPTGGGFSGGIWAGYGVGTVNSNILGNVVVDNSAIINAASGAGIGLYNWGVGNLTATLETSSAITAPAIGVNAYALGGGNVSINNKGTITVASGIGISVGTGNGVANSVNGIVSITNSGAIAALGSPFSPVVQINNDSTQGATFSNTSTGSVVAADYAVSGFNFAVADYVGAITINNSGILSGDVQLGTATINNNAGGVWNIRGSNFFGAGANAISNSGSINISGVSSLTAGTLALTNSGTINVNAGATAQVGGAVSGNGSFTIGNQAELEIVNTVGPGQTITFSPGGGLLTLDDPTGFSSTATIVAPATGDAILLQGIAVSSASNSGSITEVGGSTLTYKISGAPAADTFSVLFSSAGGSEIVLEPSAGTHLTGANAAQSFTPTTAQFYQLAANATITSSTANGLNIAATDSLSTDTINVETIQPSSITVTGAFTGINVSTTGANIAITSAGNVSSSGGVGISTSSLTGSTTIVDYGNVSGTSFAIEGITTSGQLTILVGETAQITSANARGISCGYIIRQFRGDDVGGRDHQRRWRRHL